MDFQFSANTTCVLQLSVQYVMDMERHMVTDSDVIDQSEPSLNLETFLQLSDFVATSLQ